MKYAHGIGRVYLIRQLRFSAKSLQIVGVCYFGQNFEREASVSQRVAGALNLAIAAGVDFAQDAVAFDFLVGHGYLLSFGRSGRLTTYA